LLHTSSIYWFDFFNEFTTIGNNEVYKANKTIVNFDVVITCPSFSLSPEKYDHLVSLLQQENLLSLASSPTRHVYNHIRTSSSLGHSPIDASQRGIHRVISCFIHDSYDYWLIDSGSNDYICSSLISLTSFYKIKHINVNISNCSYVLVHHASNVNFSRNLFLINVLYSPYFKLNLISVSKLCNSLSFFIQFSINIRVMQDLKSRRMLVWVNI